MTKTNNSDTHQQPSEQPHEQPPGPPPEPAASSVAADAMDAGLLFFTLKAIVLFGLLYWACQHFLFESGLITSGLIKSYVEFNTAIVNQLLHLVGEQSSIYRSSASLLQEIRAEDLAAKIVVTQQSLAMEFHAVLIAAIIAWPGKLVKKLLMLLMGIVFVFSINIARMALTLFVDIYHPSLFYLTTEWIMPVAFALLVMAFFLLWIKISGKHPSSSQ